MSACSGNGNPNIVVPDQSFDIRDGVNTKVRKSMDSGIQVYRIDVVEYEAPTIVQNHTPSEGEIGETIASVDIVFTVEQGSENIESITSDPDHSPIQIDIAKEVTLTNVTKLTPGIASPITVTILDAKGVETIIEVGVLFKHRFFQGFSVLADLNESQIEALANSDLDTSIMELYGGSNDYVVPSVGLPQYIHWLYPSGTTGISDAIFNELPLPLVSLADKEITNQYGRAITYKHVRTAVAFGAGTYTFNLI